MKYTHHIKLDGVEFDIHFAYTPAEQKTCDHPGAEEEIEITDIFLADTDHEWITNFNEETMNYFLEVIKNAR